MRVQLTPPGWATHLLSDLTDWQRAPVAVREMRPLTLPDDVYFEYAYLDAEGRRRPDPANHRPRLNPWWEYACNLVGPDYRPHPLATLQRGPLEGTLRRLALASRVLGQERSLHVYSPPGCAETALPHVVFQDGKAYLGWALVPQVYERLLAGGAVRRAHLVMIPPTDRTREYAFNAYYRRFLVAEALPCAEAAAPCNGERTAWGASLGGLLSAMLAWEHPDLFQTVVTQSGAYLFGPDQDLRDPFHGSEWLVREAERTPAPVRRWHLDCGTLEWLRPSNSRMAAALDRHGCLVELVLRPAGHNWMNWRNGLAAAFRFALGGTAARLGV
ncbi:MAG: alpha/beta hydrolase-fold protein [Candidatus Krumholzibacteriia bacterium]